MENRVFFEKYRHWIQAFWFAFTNGYARGYVTGKIYTGKTKLLCVPGLNCYSCPGAIGACPIGSLQAIIGSNAFHISLYVFGFISLFGVLLGRVVCGFLCPFGLVQDLLYKIPFPGKKKNLPGHQWLKYMRYAVLAVFVVLLTSLIHDVTGTGSPWFCQWICPSGTLMAGIPLILKNAEFQEAVGFQFFWKLSLLLIILAGSVIYYRPFCKYLCPLGAIYGVFNPVSTYRLTVNQEKCVKCGMCQKACGMDIKTYETPNSTECIRCLKCASACPKGAIESTWGISRRKFESRFLPEEQFSENSAVWNTVLLAGLSVIAGITAAVDAFSISLGSLLSEALMEVYPVPAAAAYTGFSLIKGISAFIMIIAGIILFLNRNNGNSAAAFRERIIVSFKIWIAGLVIYLICAVFSMSLLVHSINMLIITPFLPFGFPLLTWLSVLTAKKAAGGKISNVLWWFLFILIVLITASAILMTTLYLFPTA